MDIARKPKGNRKRYLYGGVGIVLVAGTVAALSLDFSQILERLVRERCGEQSADGSPE